jgi:hypothetical protein
MGGGGRELAVVEHQGGRRVTITELYGRSHLHACDSKVDTIHLRCKHRSSINEACWLEPTTGSTVVQPSIGGTLKSKPAYLLHSCPRPYRRGFLPHILPQLLV